ncbi:hypothetical protein N8Z59_04195 [Planktomarina temperata]|nr:hypothetical protein [Planktomarina temperata]
MGIYKVLPEKVKDYIRNKFRVPVNVYQNVHTDIKINEYHAGKFDYYHNKFCVNDFHLNHDIHVTRFRNYINSKYAELAVRNNSTGNFLSVGVSYGTSLKVITHLLDERVNNTNYFLIDNYQNVGNSNYNNNIDNVKNDLNDIKNFKFNFIEDLLNQSSFDKVGDNLIFTHLNTGNYKVEFEFLPQIINKTKINGVIIIDNYGFFNKTEVSTIDEFVSKNTNLFKIVFPSLQCVIIKF